MRVNITKALICLLAVSLLLLLFLCYVIYSPPLTGKYHAGYFSTLTDARQHLLFKEGKVFYVTYDEYGKLTSDIYGVFSRRDNIIFVDWNALNGPNGVPFIGRESYVLSISGLSLVDPAEEHFLRRIYW